METLMFELMDTLMQQRSLGGFLAWTALVGAVIWLPVWVPDRLASITQHPDRLASITRHLCGYGFFALFTTAVLSPLLHLSPKPSAPPLLEVTALALTALWVWWEKIRQKRCQLAQSNTFETLRQSNAHDLLNAVRIALWATLSLMPAVHWM